MPDTAALTIDYFPPEMKQLSLTAIEVLDKHVGENGRCVACGMPGPADPPNSPSTTSRRSEAPEPAAWLAGNTAASSGSMAGTWSRSSWF